MVMLSLFCNTFHFSYMSQFVLIQVAGSLKLSVLVTILQMLLGLGSRVTEVECTCYYITDVARFR